MDKNKLITLLTDSGYEYEEGIKTLSSDKSEVYKKQTKVDKEDTELSNLLVWQLCTPRKKDILFSIIILSPVELSSQYNNVVPFDEEVIKQVMLESDEFVKGLAEAYKQDIRTTKPIEDDNIQQI